MVTALILRSYDGKEEGKILCNIYQTVKNEAEHFVGVFNHLFHGLYMFVSKLYEIISLVDLDYRLPIILM